jgi:Core-2/I-Branching enzyme
MDLAHLVLAHTDPEHIGRLARKLSAFSDVYIHIDSRVDITPFGRAVANTDRVRFIRTRFPSEWGGWNAVEATVGLIREALAEKCYDRLSFLQGLDYPLKAAGDITRYFSIHSGVEFIRACNITQSSDPYFYRRCKCIWFPNNKARKVNLVQRSVSKLLRTVDIRTRSGVISDNNREFEVFWGCAQWALTGLCGRYILDFYDNHPSFNRWFYYAFPADEMYFHTIVFNSSYASRTTCGGHEPEAKPLDKWRNLHYFEWIKDKSVGVFGEKDYDRLRIRPELYLRKVTTEASTGLLDRLDADAKITFPPGEVSAQMLGAHLTFPGREHHPESR